MRLDTRGLTDTPEIHDLYETYTGGLAFDVGAAGGAVTRLIAPNFEKVISLEPSPAAYNELVLQQPGNVTALNVAASDTDGWVELLIRQMSARRGYLFTGDSLPEWGKETGRVNVPAVTLDTLAVQYGMPDFVKIDTEGHEVRVAAGAVKCLASAQFLIEVHSEDNGEVVKVMLPPARIIRHAWHPPDGYNWKNHYWMVNA